MRKKFAPLFLIPVFAYTLYFVVFSGRIAPSHPFEKSVLRDEKNTTVSINDFKGNVLIVTYFQSWCTACRQELIELMKLQDYFGNGLKVIVITDESFDISNQVKANLKIDLLFLKTDKTLKEIGIRRFPTTYLLDKKGDVVESKVEGIHWYNDKIIKEIDDLNK
ncbi:MAG: TlpA disulfide reductase family protein [Chitinophagales bacterium]